MFLILSLLLNSSFIFSQLHYQAISVQSSNYKSSKYHVFQTIGQSSPIGNFSKNNQIVFQGYHQPILKIKDVSRLNSSSVSMYPNPFLGEINFKFLSHIPKNLEISIYDINGKLIKDFYKEIDSNILKLNLYDLTNANYVITLKGQDFLYSTKIIKK